MTAVVALALSGAAVLAVAPQMMHESSAKLISGQESAEWLRPSYHFTRLQNHMNDPVRPGALAHDSIPYWQDTFLTVRTGVPAGQNGLMWRRNAAGELDYHMYFQSQDPGQSGCSQWGHTVSHDLVHWKRLPRTPIRGSSGGGLALPPSFVAPPALTGAKAITINSAPASPSLKPAVGLHLWYSSDDALLNWTEYRNSKSVQNSTNQTCVICPELVPPEFNPGYLGDNYVWAETHGDVHDFYVLSGSTKCSPGHPWCSYQGIGGNATAQAFLFHSSDLLNWEFKSQFVGQEHVAGSPQQERIDTPDTFPVRIEGRNDSQAFVWLSQGDCRTQWQIGKLDPETRAFIPERNNSSGAPLQGCADAGAMLCQQSLTTPDGSRVSFGWIEISLPGADWDGAQSLPRVVTADEYGLIYTPLPALESLHSDFQFLHSELLVGGAAPTTLTAAGGWEGKMHLKLDIQLAIPSRAAGVGNRSSFTVSLLDGATTLSLAYEIPEPVDPKAPAKCVGNIVNNSDATGANEALHAVDPEERSPEWCRAQCCAKVGCTGWVYTDPQPHPGHQAGQYICWLKSGGSSLKSGEHCIIDGGHCWAGLRTGANSAGHGGVYSVEVAGVTMDQSMRPFEASLPPPRCYRKTCTLPGSPTEGFVRLPPMEIFVDGALIEVFFNGQVLSKVFPRAQGPGVTVEAGGAGALLSLEAWRMAASIE